MTLAVKFDSPVPTIPQWWVSVTFNGKSWTPIGYMLEAAGAPFCAIEKFTTFSPDDQTDILELICQAKGSDRQAKIPTAKPPESFYRGKSSTLA